MKSDKGAFLLLAAMLAAGISIGCHSKIATFSEADSEAIRAATRQYVEMDEARNPAVLHLVANDAVYMPPGAAPLQGRNSIEGLFKAHPWEHLSESVQEIDGRGDLAFARGTWSVTFKGAPVSGSYIEVWRRQPAGDWQIVRKVWNTE